MLSGSKNELTSSGFVGFQTIAELKATKCSIVSKRPGVYLVIRTSDALPQFLPIGSGGQFKDKNPNVELDVLSNNWVNSSRVVYIGKAGGGSSKATLQKRLRTYMRFGDNQPVGHWGGRFIWQISDVNDLLICWKESDGFDAREYEKNLIEKFRMKFGDRPFANLTG